MNSQEVLHLLLVVYVNIVEIIIIVIVYMCSLYKCIRFIQAGLPDYNKSTSLIFSHA